MTAASMFPFSLRALARFRIVTTSLLFAGWSIVASQGRALADEPTEPQLREGWKWMVTIPEINREETATVLTNGNAVVQKIKYRLVIPESRILLWVEKGWLNVRRTTWDDELEWQVVLARASDPQRPVVKIDERLSSLNLTYRNFFIRETGTGNLRILREPKSGDSPEWPQLKFEPWEFQMTSVRGRSVESFESDYWTWLKAGPTRDQRDLWLRFSASALPDGRAGVGVSAYAGGHDEVDGDRVQAHVENDLFMATRRTMAAAEQGLTGAALKKKLKAEDTPALSASEWLNSDKPLILEELKGKYVLIGFWSEGSESSLKKLRQMQTLHRDFAARGLQVIGVHSAKTFENVRDLLKTHEITFPVMIDSLPERPQGIVPGETANRYHVGSLPAFFLVDSNGDVSTGYGTAPPPKELIDALLKGTAEP